MKLLPSDFDKFFKEIHGHPPFKWQSKLAQLVFENGSWPKALDMPTSTGKTAVMDIAVFHLAIQAEKADRDAPMRIAFIVDRRLVVDNAFDHALKISHALSCNDLKSENSDKTIVHHVAESLKKISYHDKPLNVIKLRGGIPKENEWIETPLQPLIIISTIDQVGSRYLFRGYGVSDGMKPIHAGLLGSDVLFLLDEAHTSRPFLDTVNEIQNIKQVKKWDALTQHPFQTMFMSATLPSGTDDVFPPEKIRNELLYNDEQIKERISAHKYAKLKRSSGDYIESFVNAACELSKDVRTVGIVVNRVYLARNVFSKIQEKIKNNILDGQVHLLTGRSRPLDRDRFISKKLDELKSGKDNKKIFFVATQCIEVGVDISFDALVTQIAPLDSLRQRFGRLNRLGKSKNSNAVIIAKNDEISKRADDYIYKNASARTWHYLKGIKDLDFGIKYFENPCEDDISHMTAPVLPSVTLLPEYIHFWMQTNPRPKPDPEPALFLHGLGSKSADVQIIWRADLLEIDLKNNELEKCKRTLVSRPSMLEAVSIPIWTAKKWLSEKIDYDISDVEGTTNPDGNENGTRNVLQYGNDDIQIIKPEQITPGDTLLVPSTYGGCDRYGWDGDSKVPVSDIGIECNLIHRGNITVRFKKEIVSELGCSEAWEKIRQATINHTDSNPKKFFEELLNIEPLPMLWQNILSKLKDWDVGSETIHMETNVENEIPQIIGFEYRKRIKKSDINEIIRDTDLENLQSEIIQERPNVKHASSSEIKLIDHGKGVEQIAERFCNDLKLDKDLSKDIKLASLLHDTGKAEHREQAFLKQIDYDEFPENLPDKQMIAKSRYKTNKDEYEKYMKLACLPKRYRHECGSVSLAKNHPKLLDANDKELVLYLIGTHHGYGRPLFPPLGKDYAYKRTEFWFEGVKGITDHSLIRLDSDWIDMYERLYHKYGPWNLAYMEAILRLADHRQSERE